MLRRPKPWIGKLLFAISQNKLQTHTIQYKNIKYFNILNIELHGAELERIGSPKHLVIKVNVYESEHITMSFHVSFIIAILIITLAA